MRLSSKQNNSRSVFFHAKSAQWDSVYMLFFHFHQSNDGSIQTASTVLPVPLMSAANFTMMYSSAGGHKETARLTEVQPRRQHFQNSHFLPKNWPSKIRKQQVQAGWTCCVLLSLLWSIQMRDDTGSLMRQLACNFPTLVSSWAPTGIRPSRRAAPSLQSTPLRVSMETNGPLESTVIEVLKKARMTSKWERDGGKHHPTNTETL